MSTLFVEPSSSLKKAMSYLAEPSHNPAKTPNRNLMFASNYHDPTRFFLEAERRINKSSKTRNKIYSIRLSFTREEFNPNSSIDQYLALEASKAFTETWLESKKTNRPYLIALQSDGQSGLLHSHIFICNPGVNGQGIYKGVSALQMQDLNDKVMRKFMLDHDRSTKVQDKLMHAKKERDFNSMLDSDNAHKYGKSKMNSRSKEKKEKMTQALEIALHNAVDRKSFLRLTMQQGIYLSHRSNNLEDLWFRRDGTYRKSISFEYKGTTARSFSLLNMNLEEIDKQIRQNRDQKQQESYKSLKKEPVAIPNNHVKKVIASKPESVEKTNSSNITVVDTNNIALSQAKAALRLLKIQREEEVIRLYRLRQQGASIAVIAASKQKIFNYDSTIQYTELMVANLTSKITVISTEKARRKQKHDLGLER